jgi:hypothetical protein
MFCTQLIRSNEYAPIEALEVEDVLEVVRTKLIRSTNEDVFVPNEYINVHSPASIEDLEALDVLEVVRPQLIRSTNEDVLEDFRPQLIRSTNGSDNDRALDESYVTYTSNYHKNIALCTIFLHTSPFLTAFNLLKNAFAKLK